MYSMTGFSRVRNEKEDYSIVCEIKSVNHRFKDIRFRMSSSLNQSQMKLRKKLDNYFRRGSFDIYINIKNNDKTNTVDLDYEKIKNFLEKFNEGTLIDSEKISLNPCNFIRPEFQIDEYNEKQENKKQEYVISTFEETLEELKRESSAIRPKSSS